MMDISKMSPYPNQPVESHAYSAGLTGALFFVSGVSLMITDPTFIMILAITYLPITVFLECKLFTYFGGGPGVMISPLIVGGACIGGLAFFAMKAQKLKTASKVIGLYIAVLVAIVMVAVMIHPTDDDELKPTTVVFKSVKAYANYSQVTYPMIYSEGAQNDALKVTAVFKFRDELPDRAIVVHYYESEKSRWKDRLTLIFEKRKNTWKQFTENANSLKASISVKAEPGTTESEIYTFTINGNTFSEKYFTDESQVGPHFASDESKWVDGQPRIKVADWERMPWKGFYRSYYKLLQRYKSSPNA
jgi:hypothetical protein